MKMKDTSALHHQTEIMLGNMLKIGVIISSSITIFGGILFLLNHGTEIPNYHIFNESSFNFSSLKNLYVDVIALNSEVIMELGILLLIATPIIRILFSVFAYAFEKDYMYVCFAIFVFLVTIYGFLEK